MNFPPKTFKVKLILYNLLVIICIATFISLYNYNSYRKDVIESETKNSMQRTRTISSRNRLAYDEMMNIALNCSQRKSLFLSLSLQSNKGSFEKRMALYASDVLKDYLAISGYSQYVSKITLYTKDKLLLQAGSWHGNYSDPVFIMNTDWFTKSLEKELPNYKLSLEKSPFPYAANSSFLPIILPLEYTYTKDPTNAWIFIGISPKLYNSIIQSTFRDKHIYVITESGELITQNTKLDLSISPLIPIIKGEIPNLNEGSFIHTLDKKKCIISYSHETRSGITTIEVIPVTEITFDQNVILRTILYVFISCIGIGLILSLLVSYQIGKPIKKLINRLTFISNGDFSVDASIESNDEIGLIGKHVNTMSGHINELMDNTIKSEEEKRHLEIKMLQAQINPHFLYNTLDSIKWIATMQKNSGIVQVVTSLSALLKNMAKGFNEKVTLKQELDFLNDYITIEKIRYIELFDVDITVSDKALYDAKIIKLTLQPLVENAIFSGIEPSLRNGLIKIHACNCNNNLVITVTDNGIGITKDQIQSLLTNKKSITGSTMSGIGLPNVNQRLKLVYGNEYGLDIESVIDSYTTITITIPLEYNF